MLNLKRVLINCIFIVLYVVSLRLTNGVSAVLGMILALKWISSRKYGLAALMLTLIAFSSILSYTITGGSGSLRIANRVGFLVLSATFIAVALSQNNHAQLPFALLFVFVAYMIFPSATGWFPVISYLKLVLFTCYAGGIIAAASLVKNSPIEVDRYRHGLMALIAFAIIGSAISRFIPSIGYSMQISKLSGAGVDVQGEEIFVQSGIRLFSGIFCHSQTCGPVVAMLMTWLACDMLFVEGRFRKFHMMLLGVAPVLMFMTRSRTALLVMIVSQFFVWLFGIKRANLSLSVKRKVSSVMFAVIILMILSAVVLEIRSKTISSWVFKGASKDISTIEAVTATRMGRMEVSIRDFKLKPMFGMGFQVDECLIPLFQEGRVNYFTAPVEKGVLPTMVLGEGGIIGFAIFSLFILVFYSTCWTKRYAAMMSLFTGFLAANMGEATFFSPSGDGGLFWPLSVIGGVTVDALSMMRMQRIARHM